jgi:hypothetical protein
MANANEEKKEYIDLDDLFSNGLSSNAPSPLVPQYSPQAQWNSPNMSANNFFNNSSAPTPSVSNLNMSMNILSQLPRFKQQLLAALAQQLNVSLNLLEPFDYTRRVYSKSKDRT